MNLERLRRVLPLIVSCLIGGPNSLGGQSREGEVTWPLMTTYGAEFEIGASELLFIKGGAG